MTEAYGLCGVGWRYEIVSQRTEPGSDGQVFAFVDVALYVKVDGEWSEPIPGTGGNLLIEKERSGLHSNDEAFKMATTDALSSAMKMIGVGHDVYAGQWTGSKYQRTGWQDKPVELSPDDAAYIADAQQEIAKAQSLDALGAIGAILKDKSPAIQQQLRSVYADRSRTLKEQQHAQSQP